MKRTWKASDTGAAEYVGLIEFQDETGEYHDFTVLSLPDRLVFGGHCNTGFLESGFIRRDQSECFDETLQELLADLQAYYNTGPDSVSRIVCNECM